MKGNACNPGSKRRLDWRSKALLSLVAFFLALLVAFPAAEIVYRKRRLAEYDRLTRDINARKENMFISVPDLLEYRMRPGFQTDEAYAIGSEPVVDPGAPWSWSINEHGYRGRPLAASNPNGGVRVAFLGDSITFGIGVNDEAAFPALLEASLRRETGNGGMECANLGVPEYNLQQMALLAAEKLPTLQPDLVVINVSVDDAEPEQMGAVPPQRRFANAGSWFLAEIATTLNAASGRTIVEPGTIEASPHLERGFETGAPKAALARAALLRITQIAAELGSRVLIVMHPDYDFTGSGDYRYDLIHEAVASWAQEARTPFVDVLKQVETASGSKRSMPEDGLWNRKALHHTIADLLTGPIVENLGEAGTERTQ